VIGFRAAAPVAGRELSERNEMSSQQPAITVLLHQLSCGDKSAFDKLMPVVYEQLRKLAGRCLLSERTEHTLPATALVHEAWAPRRRRVSWK
jgi:ECF sigma factor